jgi:hypothetical protein
VSTLEDGTIGQPDAGEMTGGGYTLLGGYWNTTGNSRATHRLTTALLDTADIDDSVFSGPCSNARARLQRHRLQQRPALSGHGRH